MWHANGSVANFPWWRSTGKSWTGSKDLTHMVEKESRPADLEHWQLRETCVQGTQSGSRSLGQHWRARTEKNNHWQTKWLRNMEGGARLLGWKLQRQWQKRMWYCDQRGRQGKMGNDLLNWYSSESGCGYGSRDCWCVRIRRPHRPDFSANAWVFKTWISVSIESWTTDWVFMYILAIQSVFVIILGRVCGRRCVRSFMDKRVWD